MSKSRDAAFSRITKNLGRLSLDQLEELKKIVHMLSLAKEKERQEEIKAEMRREQMINESFKQAREGEEVQIGYIEEKMINGFGPYLYFRYWDNGIHKSLYSALRLPLGF